MITKHPFADKARKLRPIFFQLGLLVALGTTLAAFKWTTYGDNVVLNDEIGYMDTTYEMPPINIVDDYKKEKQVIKEKKLTPPKPDQINLVDNETKVDTATNNDIPFVDLEGLLASKPINPNNGPEPFDDNKILDISEIPPTYPGGDKERVKFIKDNMRFPYDIQYAPKTISVAVSMVVEKDGSLTDIKIIRDGGFPSAGEAAKNVIAQMPKWIPGYQGLNKVRVRMVLPIKFKVD